MFQVTRSLVRSSTHCIMNSSLVAPRGMPNLESKKDASKIGCVKKPGAGFLTILPTQVRVQRLKKVDGRKWRLRSHKKMRTIYTVVRNQNRNHDPALSS